MKPILILQNMSSDGPAYFGSFLLRRGVPHVVCNAEAGQDFPTSLAPYAALAVLGGEMSANDPLPSLRRAETLIREAMQLGRPVIGHCLGGQLMARALDARVGASPAPEIGWHRIELAAGAEPAGWFGERVETPVFQWHYDAFELPAGATRLAGSPACPNQAFAIGPHLAMQFHIEVDADKIGRWSEERSARYLGAQREHPLTVQDGAALRAGVARHLQAHQALADRVYAHWLRAVPVD